MANLKEIRTRIGSVKSTQQITKAMKMVAAAKLRKAQESIIKIRPYTFKLNEVINSLSAGIEDLSSNPFYDQRETSNILLICTTSDKGLCGSFNSAIIRETQKQIEQYLKDTSKHYHVDLLCIGKKGYDYFRKKNYNIIEHHVDLSKVTFRQIDDIASRILLMFENKEYDLIRFIYNSFKNAAVYKTINQQFLPIEYHPNEIVDEKNQAYINFIFEPSEIEIINALIPTSLKINFYKNILESNAAEFGARMTAMDKATENAEELIGELRLFYNKERQAAITKEILEIIGGSGG